MPTLTSARARAEGRCGRSTPNCAASAGIARSWTSTSEGSPERAASPSRSRRTSSSADARSVATRRHTVTFAQPVASAFSIKRSGRHTAEHAPAWAHTILDAFKEEDIVNLVFLPDTVMGRLLALAESDAFFRLIPVHREE